MAIAYVYDAALLMMRWTDGTARKVEWQHRAKLAAESDIDYAAMVHGYKQKVGDCAAIPKDPKTGKSATDADKMDAMAAKVADLRAGVWNARGGVAVADVAELAEAISAAWKRDVYKVRVELLAMDAKTRDGLACVPEVLAEIEKARKARASTIDKKALDTIIANMKKC